MNRSLRSLFAPVDSLSGSAYLAWGIGLFAFKYLLDFLINFLGFGIFWLPTDYFFPRAGRPEPGVNLPLLAAAMMLALAVPFIWIGVNLTLRRLRTLNWPALWACTFFVPYVNFVFFATLVFKRTPSRRPASV